MNRERVLVWVMIALAAGKILGAMLRLEPVMSAPDGSRWNTVWALTHGKGYVVDGAPYFDNIDTVFRGGHYYSSKPALLPTVVAGFAWVLKTAAGLEIPENCRTVVRTILVLFNIIPFAFFLFFYARLLERKEYDPATRLYCLAAAAFATYMTAYSVCLNNHTVAGWAALFALYCYIRIAHDGESWKGHYVLCGLFSAWTAANELPAVVFLIALFAMLLRRDSKATLACFLLPALAIVAAFFWANYQSTGKFDIFYLHFRDQESSLYRYAGSHWNNPQGVDAVSDPKWLYLFNLTFGHHGIWSLTPVFLLSFYGMLRKEGWTEINRLGLFLTLALLAFFTATTTNYGGGAYGPRWLIWLTPFWLISLAPVVQRHSRSRVFWALALIALLWSAAAISFAMSAQGVRGWAGPWGTLPEPRMTAF